MPNSFKFIIHNLYTLPSMHIHFPSGHYIIIHSYTSQTSKSRKKHHTRMHSRPALRSCWRVSLKR